MLARAACPWILVAVAAGCDSAGGTLDVGSDQAPRGSPVIAFDATTDAVPGGPLTVTLAQTAAGSCGTCVQLTAQIEGGTAPYAFQWSPSTGGDGGTVQVCPTAPTAYSVTVTDSSGRSDEFVTGPMSATASATVDGAGSPCPQDAGFDGGDAGTQVFWADWQSQDGGVVLGTIALPTATINVTYTGEVTGLQTTTGTDYFLPVATFTAPTVSNPPPGPGMIEVSGTTTLPDSVTFSQPVQNPVVAIYNLGTSFASQSSFIAFGAPFVVLSSGPNSGGTGYWGNEQLVPVDGGLSGVGSNGIVELEGTFTTITWTNPADITYASYTGLTVGVRAQP
jgi:hypothetical protein